MSLANSKRALLCLLGGAASLFCVVACAASVSEARGSLAQYREASKAATDAMNRNDVAAFSANAAKAQEFLRQARAAFDDAHAVRSDDVDVLRDYSMTLEGCGDFDLAAEVLQRATSLKSDDAALWLALGRLLSRLGERRSQDAVEALHRAIDVDATNVATADAYAVLGQIYRDRRLFDLSREYVEKAIAVNPDHAGAKSMLAVAKLREGAVLEASNDLDQLGALPPDLSQRLPDLLSEAIQGFQKARKVFADTAENHMAYAKLLFRAGRPQEALWAAERSAALDPGNFAVWNFVGDLSQQFGRIDRARQAYNKSLELKPDQPRTQESLKALDAAPAPAVSAPTPPEPAAPPIGATPPPTPPS